MLSQLPRTLSELLTPAGLRLLERPPAALRAGLSQADSVCRWAPGQRVTLFSSVDDEQAVADNTGACARRLRTRGTHPRLVDVGSPELFGSRHIGTNIAGTTSAVRSLASLAAAG